MLHVDVADRERPCGPAPLPEPRGPLTASLFPALCDAPGTLDGRVADQPFVDDLLWGEDAPLALYCLYELHYRGFLGVDEAWEWDPDCLRLRRRLERAFTDVLELEVGALYGAEPVRPDDVVRELRALATAPSVSLSTFLETEGTLGQLREFAAHRSPYQRKEADPHSWAIPRLTGRAKAALVSIQFGEYGDGRASHMHAELFGDAMRALGVDSRYGALLDWVPGSTLATVNLVSMFGLHRRWRGALVGHLALFEMCSVVPMGRYVGALRRLGVEGAVPFYQAHVDADVSHERIALDEMVGGLLREEPALGGDVVFGARALDCLERCFTERLLDRWAQGRTSLRMSLP